MAAIASPMPVSFSSSAHEHRRPLHRSISRSAYSQSYGQKSSANLAARLSQKNSTGDSSDDDDLAPIKLSAEARAILGEDNSHPNSDKENVNSHALKKMDDGRVRSRAGTPVDRLRASAQANGSPAPRVVRSAAPPRPAALTAMARDGSFMYRTHDKTQLAPVHPSEDSQTPPKTRRVIRVSGGRRSSRSPIAEHPNENREVEATVDDEVKEESPQSSTTAQDLPAEDNAGVPPSTIMRSRRGDENGVHSTRLIRRIGNGTMLARPVRRGMIRRPSEDDEVPQYHDGRDGSQSPEIEMGRRAQEPDLDDDPNLAISPSRSPRGKSPAWLPERPKSVAAQSVAALAPDSVHQQDSPYRRPISAASGYAPKPTPASNGSHPSTKSSGSQRKPIFKIPALPPVTAEHSQENEPPPTFKKSKPSAPLLQIHEDDIESAVQHQQQQQPPQPATQSPARPPLVPRSNNTPHRPAPPPPPKMSLLEAATSQSTRKKTSTHITINHRQYRKLDCVGRGGSSRVYRIMADNYRIFAMKRVNLEDADATAIAGYKGEIDLLTRLANVQRVIRLFDYEINDDKGTLTMMMELGESDFNKMLNEQIKGEEAKMDVTFTRHYWKEMLECVQAVHNHGVVHSDLKPANFLLVKGQLKLIDFGIANAIQDNTVNVYRENQIGTPNYMSPESLICQSVNVGPGGEQQKEIKLGRPSDVWSLGCILYQMTYGQPPFAHIAQHMQRILAIPNPKVEINFPARGIGGAVVPFGLIKTLRRCLTREQSLRPTIDELLSEQDPFLNPVAISPDMLGRVIGNVVSYCRRREDNMRKNGEIPEASKSALPGDEEMKGWPGAFYEKLRQAMSEGTAW